MATPAAMRMVSMAGDGTIMVVDTNQNVLSYSFTTRAWTAVGKQPMAQVSVGSASQVCGIDTRGQPAKLTGSSGQQAWQAMGTATLASIACAGDGTVWGTDASNTPMRWNGTGWDVQPGSASQVAVGSQGLVWSLDASGNPQSWTGSGWQAQTPLGQPIASLVAGSDSHVWALGARDQTLYMFDGTGAWLGSDWGPLAQVGGTDSYNLVGVTPLHPDGKGNRVNELWFGSAGALPLPRPDFAPPTQVAGILMANTPALAVLGNRLVCALPAADPSNMLYVSESTDGTTWTVPARGYGSILTGTAVSLATLNNRLYCVFGANGRGDLAPQPLCMTSSADGVTWSAVQSFPGMIVPDGGDPSLSLGVGLATFNGKLWCAFRARGATETVCVSASDGTGWQSPAVAYSAMQPYGSISGPPALAAFNGRLYLAALRSLNDGPAGLFVLSSADGATWSAAQQVGGPQQTLGMSMNSPPALVVFRGRLYCAFLTPFGWLCMTSTTDGQHWEPDLVTYPNFTTGDRGANYNPPSFAVMNDTLFVAVQDVDSHLMTVSKASAMSNKPSPPLPPPPGPWPPSPPGRGAMM